MLRSVSASAETLVIDSRFNGPPESGNGGYVCGLVAGLLGTGPAEVALRVPPPLDSELAVRRSKGAASLYDEDVLVAEGRALEKLELEVPEVLDADAAAQASSRYPWIEEHYFPTCFVCGPKRPHHDGLEIFTGQAGSTDLFGATWTPAVELADESGRVRSEIVWAALDCPTGLVAVTSGEEAPGVLGTLAASIDGPIEAGHPYVITAWLLGIDGRKRTAAAVISDSDGSVVARSRAMWIELRL